MRKEFDKADRKRLERLVGPIKDGDLRLVEPYLSDQIAAFMPVGGQCGYATTKDHTHPSCMFILNFDDRGIMELNGQLLHSTANYTFYLAPEIPHQELKSELPSRFIALFIDPDLLEREMREYGIGLMDLPQAAYYPTPEQLVPLLKYFMEETGSSLPGRRRLLDSISVQIVHTLIRMQQEIDPLDKYPSLTTISENFRVNQAIDWLYANIEKSPGIKNLAEYLGLSESHFIDLFKRETGETPHQYLLIIRLDRARRLLLSEELSLTEIALNCGFSSSAHFSSTFRKYYGVSPSDYKKSHGV